MSVLLRVKDRIKAALKQQPGGMLDLSNTFKSFDTDGSGTLNWEEFCNVFQQCGLAPSPQDIRAIFVELDKNGDGQISYDEFLLLLRGEMSKQRKNLIIKIFESVDSDYDGVISMADIGKCFNPKNHPEVKSGRKSANNFMQEFFESFGSVTQTGYVNLQQFIDYYANISAFDDDIKFNETVKAVWTLKSDNAALNKASGGAQQGKFVNAHQSNIGSLISENDGGVSKNMDQLREQLLARGARGIVGLQRKFRIMDDDGSKSLNMSEFKKGMRECSLNFTEQQLNSMFTYFDKDRSGTISFDEFITGIRGTLNPKRKLLVKMAFNVLDKDGSGEVDPEDIVGVYDASKHPDVMSGKRTEDDVLREFLETFDVGGVKDGKVTREEFDNYYANISASIDDDQYFELMIRNAWHISGGEGAAANSANRRVLVTARDGSQSVQEIKNDLGLRANDKAGMMSRLQAQGVDVGSISLYDGADNTTKASKSRAVLDRASNNNAKPKGVTSLSGITNAAVASGGSSVDTNALRVATAGPNAGGATVSNTAMLNSIGTLSKSSTSLPSMGLIHIITKLKAELKSRGAGGFIGLQRKFKIMDDDNSKTLNLAEFKKAMKEMNLSLADGELRMLFEHFDSDHSGTIDFEEFIQGVRDPLTERRLRLVQQAFAKIDKDSSGCVDAQEIASVYDASKHPEVLAGRKTERQVLTEFLNTFDVGGVVDGMVTTEEFINYYTNLGANIDNEDYFELMIRNAWHISGGEGAAANSANRRVLVTAADGSQFVQEIHDDLGLKANDKVGMMSRLKAQGVSASSISLYDGGDDNNKSLPKYQTKPKPGQNSHELLFGTGPIATPPAPPTRQQQIAAEGPNKVYGGVERVANKTLAVGSTVFAGASNVPSQFRVNTSREITPGLQLIVAKIKKEMKARGANGFIGLQRKFRIMDDDNSKTLSLAEFKKAMNEMNMGLADSEMRMLFEYFDVDSNGTIDFEEFIQGVRDPLTPRRLALVKLAFSKLDKDGNGCVDAQEVASLYDASKHPDVIAGKRTPAEILREFLNTFDVGGVVDGMVTTEEFINYYTNLGANIDNEDYFELMIRNAWHISGGEGAAANSANRRVLVTARDGSQSVQEIKNDLGLKANDKAGMMSRLQSQGVDVGSISLYDGGEDNGKSSAAALGSAQRKRFSQDAHRSSMTAGLLPGTGKPDIPKGSKLKIDGAASVANGSVGVRIIVSRLKEELKTRGGSGFIGLQRKFRIMDDDNSKSLDQSEFKKAMREMNLNLTDAELRLLFEHFDADHSGTIDFEEFIQGVRDPLTPRRLALVKQAFAILDTDGSGIIDAAEVAAKYDASMHPEVIAGRKTAKEVLAQFLDTFDVGGVKDGMVTEDEFVNYYTNIGANIDRDDYFELMIRNAWHISGGEGAAANSANRRVLVTARDGSQSVQEIKNDLGLRANDKAGMMSRLKAQGVNASNISLFDGGDDNKQKLGTRPSTANKSLAEQAKETAHELSGRTFSSQGVSSILSQQPPPTPQSNRKAAPAAPYGIQVLIDKIKGEMKKRGAGGFIGLQRKFRIMDDDGSKTLNLAEFKKGLKEMNFDLIDSELRALFDHFDSDHSGTIDFEEFIQGVRDPLTPRRLALVKLAFNQIDRDGSGAVDAQEVASMYDASRHPDVISGKKTAQQVLTEFLNTFDVGGVVDGMVTTEEFINYYTNLGANIDNEDYFELMIRNAWHISGGEGAAANSANRRVLVTAADGSQYVQEIKNDLGLKANDKAGMMDRLKSQGVFASQISLFGEGEDNKQKLGTRPSTAPSGGYHGPLKRPNETPKAEITNNIFALGPGSRRPVAAASDGLATANSLTSYANNKSGNKNVGAHASVREKARVQLLLDDLREQMAQRGAKGIIGLQRKFRIMDDNGDHALNIDEFKKAMKECQIKCSDEDIMLLFHYFDCDGSNDIDFEEFLQGIKGPQSEKRRQLIALAFNTLDSDGSGEVEPEEIMGRYDASRHPDVLSGKRTPNEILREFLDTFDVGGVKDGKVTRQEFENYYSNVGASIDDDQYFELMIRNAWHISGGEGAAANSANRRVLVTAADGSQYVQEIKNDLGLRANDKAGMMDRLKSQGVFASQISLFGEGEDNNKVKFGARPSTAPSPGKRDTSLQFGLNEVDKKSGRRGFNSAFQSQLKIG